MSVIAETILCPRIQNSFATLLILYELNLGILTGIRQ